MNRRHSGFTLIELMITLAVAAILLGVAVPSFTSLIQRNQLMTLANQIHTDLMAARGEAIKRNQPVVICRSTDGVSCAASGSWNQGWLIYVDVNNNAALDTGEPLVKSSEAIANGYNIFTGYTSSLTFRADGSVDSSGSFTVCDRDGVQADSRTIDLNLMGRPKRESGTHSCS